MDKKVVVTGCSGFIGFHLSNSLLETDIQVIGIDSLNSAYDIKLKQKRLEKLDKNNKIGKSSVWTIPGIISKWGMTEIKNKIYKGEKLLSLFIFNPHH